MYLRGNLSLVLSISLWEEVAIDVSVEVVGGAGMDCVSEDYWSIVEWCVATGKVLHKDMHAGPFLTGRSSVIVGCFNELSPSCTASTWQLAAA